MGRLFYVDRVGGLPDTRAGPATESPMSLRTALILLVLLAAPAAAQAPVKPLPTAPADPLAGADLARGEGVWRQCRACHSIEPGRHGIGPSLHGVVGAPVGAQNWGRPYSLALQRVGGVWTVDRLSAYLENPRAFAPGGLMAYAGLRDPADRLNLIAWLAAQGR